MMIAWCNIESGAVSGSGGPWYMLCVCDGAYLYVAAVTAYKRLIKHSVHTPR